MLAPATYTRVPAVEEKPMGREPQTSESKGYTNSRGTIERRDEVPATMSLVGKTSFKAARTTLLPTRPGSPLAMANINLCLYFKCGGPIRRPARALQAFAPITVGRRLHVRPGLQCGSATRRLRNAQDRREPRLSNSVINQ